MRLDPEDVHLLARLQDVKFEGGQRSLFEFGQPLHVGDRGDRGGNDVKVLWRGKETNLHAVWDTGLIEQWPGGWSDSRRPGCAQWSTNT